MTTAAPTQVPTHTEAPLAESAPNPTTATHDGALKERNGEPTTAPVSPKVNEAQMKEHQKMEKLLAKDAKGDEKQLKAALKTANSQAKAEAKSLKSQNKAQKALEKAKAKEYKYQKGLTRAQGKHNEAVAKVKKAEEILAAKTQQHQSQLAAKDTKLNELDRTKAMKAEHDAQRAASLKASEPSTTV